jgi:hypothetical protein
MEELGVCAEEGDEERAFPATVDERLMSCMSGWVARSWLKGRMLGVSHGVVSTSVCASCT